MVGERGCMEPACVRRAISYRGGQAFCPLSRVCS